MASSPTTDRPAGSTAEVLVVISALVIGLVIVTGTFAPQLLPWANGVVNDIAEAIGIDF